MSNFRLLQLVIFAGFCLLLLKSSALIFSGGDVLTGAAPLNAQETEEAAARNKEKDQIANGENKDPAKELAKGKNAGDLKEQQTVAKAEDMGEKQEIERTKPVNYAVKKVVPSNSELDLLESLALRRKQLNLRETQLKLKENLLMAAQKQIDERISQLKKLEAKIQVDLKKQDVLKDGQYKRLVKIYSSMKPKEAARIFNGLNMEILVDLVRAMKAAAGSQILAKMEADKARAVTMILAKKEKMVMAKPKDLTSDLPKIVGDRPAEGNK